MRVLRITMYPPNDNPALVVGTPVTVVTRDVDLSVSIEEAIESQKALDGEGIFTTYEVVEIEETDIASTVFAAMHEADDDHERNMAILYYYDARALSSVTPHGALSATVPAPLSVEQISETLRQLAKHPNYKHQRVLCQSEDGTVVAMQDGEITVL